MRLWTLAVAVAVVVVAADDSLRRALNAVNRRQRDLAESDYVLRYLAAAPTKHYLPPGIGQPEDIGYGFQKSGMSGGGMYYSPSHIPDAMEPGRGDDNVDRMLLGYIEEDEPEHVRNSAFRELEKKSLFREQQEKEDEDVRSVKPSEDGEYMSYLQSAWRKYRQQYPATDEGDDMSQQDVARILKYMKQHATEGAVARPPNNFDEENREDEFLGEPRVWAGRSHHNKFYNVKNDEDDESRRNVLYTWKYGPSTSDRVYAGVFGGEGNTAGQNYDDNGVLSKYSRDQWLPMDGEYMQKEDNFPEYSPEEEKPRKRFGRPTYALLQPAYSSSDHKRFSVRKRSPRQYTSPPLLHHEKRTGGDKYGARKNATTDPKVVKELNQIFSSDEGIIRYESYNDEDLKPGDQKVFSVMPVSNETHDKSKRLKKGKENVQKVNNVEDDSVVSQQEDEPIEIKKKSIDWSDYFGIDRRRKKLEPEQDRHLQDSADRNYLAEKWLQENYQRLAAKLTPEQRETAKMFKLYESAIKRSQMFAQPFDTRNFETTTFTKDFQKHSLANKSDKNDEDNNTEPLKIDTMDKKLQHIEDLILNQAVKYTGAHEDTTDSQEIQKVKDNVISQLAAAYSLEKIRKALGEFKSILASQRNSNLYPENEVEVDLDEKMKKRMAVKKGKFRKGVNNADKQKSSGDDDDIEDSVAQLLEDPIALTQLSEGYMGGKLAEERNDCADVSKMLKTCHSVDDDWAVHKLTYAPLCCLRQLCYACSPLVGQGPTHCDALLADVCGDDAACLDAAKHCDAMARCNCVD